MSSPVDPNNGISNFSNPNKRKEKPTPLTLSPEAVFRMISATPPPQQATPLIASRVAISPKSSPPEFARPITPLPSILRQTIAPQTPRGPMPLSPPRNRFQGFDESPETDSTVPSMQRDYVSIQFSNPQPSDPLPMPTRSLLLSNPNEGLNASDNLFPSETSRLAASRHPRAPSPDASSSSVPAQTEMNADQKLQSAMANLPELVYRGTNHLAVKKALLFYMVFRQDFSCLLAQPAKAWNFVLTTIIPAMCKRP